jgi:hypothetical protein
VDAFGGDAPGRTPPERYEGHKDRSSGSDVPGGAMCDSIAAAFGSVVVSPLEGNGQ